MTSSIVWHTLLVFIIYISICKEENYEVSAKPVRHIAFRSNCNSVEDYVDEAGSKVGGIPHSSIYQEDETQVGLGVGGLQHSSTYQEDETKNLPKHRAHLEYVPYKPKKRKKSKKHKKLKVTEVTETNKRQKKKSAKRKHAKTIKTKKESGEKRKPFDITVHIKMDDIYD